MTKVQEAFRASLQRCMNSFPLRHLSLQAVSLSSWGEGGGGGNILHF